MIECEFSRKGSEIHQPNADSNRLNSSPLVFPVLECFHIVAIALSVGKIAIAEFRLPGFGIAQLVGRVSLLRWACVVFGGTFIRFLNPTMDLNHVRR